MRPVQVALGNPVTNKMLTLRKQKYATQAVKNSRLMWWASTIIMTDKVLSC